MKNINFRKITIKNFLSVGPEPVVLDIKEGLNIITGYNRDEEGTRNGVGKSLIVDALYFTIFGNTLR
jgi:AAA15 family ATPase/GTPase